MALTAVLTVVMTRPTQPLVFRDKLPAPREVAEEMGSVLPRARCLLKSGAEEEHTARNSEQHHVHGSVSR